MKKILSLLMAVTLTLSLAACSSAPSPEDAVTNGLEALKALDGPNIEKYFKDTDIIGELDAMAGEDMETTKLFLSQLSYKVISSKVEKETATVSIEATNLDMSKIFAAYMEEAMGSMLQYSLTPEAERPSEEEMQKEFTAILTRLLADPASEKITTAVDVKLSLVDGQWKMEADPALGNAVLGGLLDVSM